MQDACTRSRLERGQRKDAHPAGMLHCCAANGATSEAAMAWIQQHMVEKYRCQRVAVPLATDANATPGEAQCDIFLRWAVGGRGKPRSTERPR